MKCKCGCLMIDLTRVISMLNSSSLALENSDCCIASVVVVVVESKQDDDNEDQAN